MAKCTNCGTELEEGQKFCFECGTPVPQTKKCIKCGTELPLKMKFCPECGANQNGGAAAGGDGSFNLGDKNVIGGDVIGHKDETHVAGNATFIKNEDQTKQVKKCHICGSLVSIVQGFDCPVCHQFTCETCFNADENCCNDCAAHSKDDKINRYKEALRMVLADGRIEASERRELIALQQQLGITNEMAKQFEDELKNVGNAAEFTTFEKINFDKAFDLYYKQGKSAEALKLLTPVVSAHSDDEKVLNLYLPVLAEENPEQAKSVISKLNFDILMAFITKAGIYIREKNLNEAEKTMNQAVRIWRDNSLVKCYQVLLNFAFYKQSDDSSFLEKAVEIAGNLGNAENELELSYQVKVQSILQEEAGEEPLNFDEEFCQQNNMLWWVMNSSLLLDNKEYRRKKTEPIVGHRNDCDFDSIQEAMDFVDVGATIHILSGKYKEHLKFTKKVHLVGVTDDIGEKSTEEVPIIILEDEEFLINIDGICIEGVVFTQDENIEFKDEYFEENKQFGKYHSLKIVSKDIYLENNGFYQIPGDVNLVDDADVKITGCKFVRCNLECNDFSQVTYKDSVFIFESRIGFLSASKMTFDNCSIESEITVYSGNININNCHVIGLCGAISIPINCKNDASVWNSQY